MSTFRTIFSSGLAFSEERESYTFSSSYTFPEDKYQEYLAFFEKDYPHWEARKRAMDKINEDYKKEEELQLLGNTIHQQNIALEEENRKRLAQKALREKREGYIRFWIDALGSNATPLQRRRINAFYEVYTPEDTMQDRDLTLRKERIAQYGYDIAKQNLSNMHFYEDTVKSNQKSNKDLACKYLQQTFYCKEIALERKALAIKEQKDLDDARKRALAEKIGRTWERKSTVKLYTCPRCGKKYKENGRFDALDAAHRCCLQATLAYVMQGDKREYKRINGNWTINVDKKKIVDEYQQVRYKLDHWEIDPFGHRSPIWIKVI